MNFDGSGHTENIPAHNYEQFRIQGINLRDYICSSCWFKMKFIMESRGFSYFLLLNPQDCDVCLDIPWSRGRVIHIIQVMACCFIFCCQMSLDIYSTKSDLELGLENSPQKNTFLILLVSLWGDLFWCSWEFLTAPLLGAQLLILFLHTRLHMPLTAFA